jgi:hypothetical protein
MIKTISLYELKVFQRILENYFWYVTNQQQTFIAKILGIFTYEGFEIGPISIVMMKNVSKCPKGSVVRIFDLKGSSYDREVMKSVPGKDSTK